MPAALATRTLAGASWACNVVTEAARIDLLRTDRQRCEWVGTT